MQKSDSNSSTVPSAKAQYTPANRSCTMRTNRTAADVVRIRRVSSKPITKPSPSASVKTPTPIELKNRAIEKALKTASSPSTDKKSSAHFHISPSRVMLALGCAAAAVFSIVYFVNLNVPDISLRVAAMQTGIEARYPSHIPRDFSLAGITSEEGKITLNFTNSKANCSFTLVEEKSSWDSNALVTNFVKPTYGDNYTPVREQGLTIYINNSNAAWVSDGIVYKLTTNSGSLTKKQIKSIAVSL